MLSYINYQILMTRRHHKTKIILLFSILLIMLALFQSSSIRNMFNNSLPISPLINRDKLLIDLNSLKHTKWLGLDEILKKSVRDDGSNDLIILTANSGFEDFLMNWICFASKIDTIKNKFLIFSLENNLTLRLQNAGYNVYTPREVSLFESIISQDQLYGSVEYQILVLLRTLFIQACISRGYNILIADIDSVWLSDPFIHFHNDNIYKNKYVLAPRDSPNEETACGCLVYLKQGKIMKSIWDGISNEHFKIVIDAIHRGKLTHQDQSEQELLSDAIASLGENFQFLERDYFPSGKYFFDMKIPQSKNIEPVVIHNNWIFGGNNKRQRFKDNDLWIVNIKDDLVTYNVNNECI